jgi:hypothetical protein
MVIGYSPCLHRAQSKGDFQSCEIFAIRIAANYDMLLNTRASTESGKEHPLSAQREGT